MSARSIRRVAALGAVLATGVTAAPALAHAPVLGTSPGKGATVTNVRRSACASARPSSRA